MRGMSGTNGRSASTSGETFQAAGRRRAWGLLAMLGVCVWTPVLTDGSACAADCTRTSVGVVPLNDLGSGLYIGQYEGGLYPAGRNVPPSAHAVEGAARARAIEPLDPNGQPDPNGVVVMLSIGMSNTTQEFCSQSGQPPCDPWTFTGQALVHPEVNTTTLVIANGARGGQSASTWDDPADPNYDRVRDTVLAPQGLAEAQVQVVWVKQANPGPQQSLPSPQADAFRLVRQLGDIARAVQVRYPNARSIFFSSRIYAGYASTTLNPEPYAYESGFGVKWLIEAQISQMAGGGIDPRAGDLDYDGVAPWLGWAAYLWADGLNPRSDGLTWVCLDFANDGTHPAPTGEEKVGRLLLEFFLASPFSRPWFTVHRPADINGDGVVDVLDLLELLGAWGPCPPPPAGCPADTNGDGSVDVLDLLDLLAAWG